MNDASTLPDELVNAVRSLEDRFRLLHVSSRRIPESEWSVLPETVRLALPTWLPALLSNHILAGGVLEYRDRKEPVIRQFAFFEPSDYASSYQEGSLLRRLIGVGFLAFANEAGGNLWLTRFHDGPASPVYLLELSAWNGDEPTVQNGLVFASSSLALLLASMGVSEASFYHSPEGPTHVLWHKARKMSD